MKRKYALPSWALLGILIGFAPSFVFGAVTEGPLQAYLGKPKLEMTKLFDQERFPNVVVTTQGTVLVTFGSESVKARRSTDGGKT